MFCSFFVLRVSVIIKIAFLLALIRSFLISTYRFEINIINMKFEGNFNLEVDFFDK